MRTLLLILFPLLLQAQQNTWVLIEVKMDINSTLETYQNARGERVTVVQGMIPHGNTALMQEYVELLFARQKLLKQLNQDLIDQANKDPTKEVTKDAQGNTIIKDRTELSKNPTDPSEYHSYNMQRVFNWGFGLGTQMLAVNQEQQQRIKDGDTSQMLVDIHLGIRLPYPFAKRFLIGGSYSARNALRGPSESVPWAPPDGDGFTTYPLASDTYKTIFLEYDVLVLPGDDAKIAFSAGVFKGFAEYKQSDHPFKYTEQGITAKARFFLGSGRWDNGTVWELAPFIAYRHGDKKMSAFYAGLGFGFGPEMKKLKKQVRK